MSKNYLAGKGQIFLFLSLIFTNQSSVLAVPPTAQQEKIMRDKRVLERQRYHKAIEKYERLKEPADLPDLPTYSGHTKFISGYLTPPYNGISTCQMNFYADEEPQVVSDFYKDALTANRWKILYAGKSSISARHADGHMCVININASKIPKTKSKFYIAYRQMEKQH